MPEGRGNGVGAKLLVYIVREGGVVRGTVQVEV